MMLRSTILAAMTSALMLANAAPASANAAAAGLKTMPAVAPGALIEVRRGGHGGHGGFRAFGGGGGHAFRGGGGGFRHFRGHAGPRLHFGGRRHFGGHRHFGHRHHRRYRGLYFAAPFITYGAYNYGSCHYLKRKAIRTGSRYWWRRYYRCRNHYDY